MSPAQRLSLAGDLLSWVVAIVVALAYFNRSIFDAPNPALITLTLATQFVVGTMTGLYGDRFRRLSFDEAGVLALTVVPVGVLLVTAEFLMDNTPRAGQTLAGATTAALCLMFGHRYVQRYLIHRRIESEMAERTPVVVYGAGEGGYRAIHAMTSSHSSYRPVALVDDDPTKRNLRIQGLRVEGTSDHLPQIVRRHRATAVLLALPRASGAELHELNRNISELGVETLVMPPVQKLVGEGSTREFSRYRDEDILNRQIVDIDDAAVRSLITGSSVLVTGAGGSIGSELTRQLASFNPAKLTCVDHDDSLLHEVMRTLDSECEGVYAPVLADIRDIQRLDEVVADARPDIVFHAAALKHVPALELAPGEGWKTNVLGSSNVVDACERHGVARLVNISTDKAANPSNVLGFTKRIAERLTAAAAKRSGRTYVSVRFGNVIGSRGSALETFERQISEGGPVTITHEDVTRYFMAVREAVRLTMQAATIGRSGETMVLDMGTPVKVADIARQLVEQADADIDIVFTGLRPGEKMHEVLLSDEERAERPLHPMIDHVTVQPLELVVALDQCSEANISPITHEGLSHIAGLPEPGRIKIHRDVAPSLKERQL